MAAATIATTVSTIAEDQARSDSQDKSQGVAALADDEEQTFTDSATVPTSDAAGGPAPAVTPSDFTPDEVTALGGLDTKYENLRTNALLVAKGHFTGLYAYGPGGGGKSHQIRKALESAHMPCILVNTHVTGAALFRKMAANPHGLYLVEDLETLFHDKIARNALRAALWGERDAEGKMIRHVTYTTMRDQIAFNFEGGIIFTMNRPLKDIPEIAALATRILVTHFAPTRTELLAIAKKISLSGYHTEKGTLTADQTLEVFNYYKAQLHHIPDRLPDLRLLFKGFEYRLAVAVSSLPNNPLTWQESFRAQLDQSQEAVVYDRKSRVAQQETLALELYAQRENGVIDGKEMLARFKADTGVSSSQTFYNRLKLAQARSRTDTPAVRNGEAPSNGRPDPS
jgi:hypothetical protein